MEQNANIEKEVKKMVSSRYEKVFAEKDKIIQEKEKKIKDLNNEIDQIYSKFGSYLKVKR